MLSLQENFTYNATFSRNVQYQFIIIISISYIKNNSRYSKNPPYNSFYSVLQHNNNYVAERTKEEKYMVKRRLKSIIATVLVAAMLTTMAPQVVCEAAETAWKIVNNQETPLDEVYFDCKKSDDATKSYLYGYKDGKVAIMDSDYNLVKKTDYDEIAAMKKKVNGVTAYIVSKKVGKEKYYGIMSETGKTILEPKYLYMWSGDNAIQIEEKVNGEQLVGLLSYDDLKQIVPCEYKSILSISTKDDNMLVTAIGSDGSFNAILDGKLIINQNKTNEDDWYEFYLKNYNEQKCILCKFIPENENDDIVWSYFSYDGKLIKELTNEEYEKEQNGNDSQNTDKDDCDKWLNEACESDKLHVEEFYKSKNITPSNLSVKTYDGHEYYWVIVTGKYKDTDGQETENKNIIYSFIYDRKGKCLLSGRSFFDRSEMLGGQSDREGRCLLDDTGWMCYLNDDNNEIERLFEVKDDRLPYMCGDSSFNKEHYLIYECGNIIETGKDYKRIFVYIEKKVYTYDYKYENFYFIGNGNNTDMYYCGLKRGLSNLEKSKYEGKILFQKYRELNVNIGEIIISSIYSVENGILANNENSRKIYYFGKNKQYVYTYEKLGISQIEKDEDGNILNGEIYIKYVIGCNSWIYFNIKINDTKQYFCINTEDGIISNVVVDKNCSKEMEKTYSYNIFESDDNLYLYSSITSNIISIDKKTFKTDMYSLNFNTEDNKIDSLFMLDDKVYAQYIYSEEYYGIMDLSGKKYIDASLEECKYKFEIYGNYVYQYGKRIYDSSLKPLSEYASVQIIYDNRKKDEYGEVKAVDGLYEINCENTINTGGMMQELYTIKLLIIDNNIGKVIYEVDDDAYLKNFTHIDNYYIMSIYNSKSKTTERVIIDASTGEQLYNGDGYIYIDDFNKKFVVINKRKNSPTSIPTGSATTAPTKTPTLKPTESAVPAPTINPTEAPISTVNPLGTPVPTSTTKPTQIPDGNTTEGIIGPSQPTPTVRPTETPVPITTVKPTENPAQFPTIAPTESPTATPTAKPVNTPAPTQKPTALPVTISVAKKSVKVKTGKSTKISYSAYNTKGKRVKVKAVSSNTKAAKVSVLSTSQLEITVPDNAKDGAVSKITLTNGKKKTTIKVTVQAVKNKVIKLEAENKKISVKKGDKLSVTYYYNAQNDKKKLTDKVKIKSSDEAIAKIVTKKILNGEITVKIKGVNKGKVDITVKVGGKSATTKVTVK